MTHLRRWGATYLLLLLFIGSWLGQQHEQPFRWGEFMHNFLASTFETWQSERLRLIFQGILLLGAKHWLFKVDAEDLERIEAKVDDIKDRLGLPTPPPS